MRVGGSRDLLTRTDAGERMRIEATWRRVGAWCVAVGACVLPLAVLPFAYDAFVLPKLALGQLLAALLAALLLGRWAMSGVVLVRRTPVDVPFGLFIVAALVSSVVSVNANLSIAGAYLRYDGWSTLVTYGALFWLAVQHLATAADARRVVTALLIGGTSAAAIAVVQVATAAPGSPGETPFAFAGLARPDATLANPNTLAMYLAMLLPLAVGEAGRARSAVGRVATAGAAALIVVALALTFSRSAWLGALVGLIALMLALPAPKRASLVLGVVLAGVAATLGVLGPVLHVSGADALVARIASFGDLTTGSAGTRLHIWADTTALVAARPLFGFGPDTFALVYPLFQTGDWTPGARIDKAHADVLQVAATQGLVGVALYLATLAAVVVAFFRSPHRAAGSGLFAGWLAYIVALQLNFTSLAAEQTFWLLTATALVAWGAVHMRSYGLRPRVLPAAGVAAAIIVVVLVTWSVSRALAAEVRYRAMLEYVAASRIDEARRAIESARALAPLREQYATAAADLSYALGTRTGSRVELERAATAYQAAARLGASDPGVFRRLATVDQALGRAREAADAARRAAELDPFGPAMQKEYGDSN